MGGGVVGTRRRIAMRGALVLALAAGVLTGLRPTGSVAVPETVVRSQRIDLSALAQARDGARSLAVDPAGTLRAAARTRTAAVTRCAPMWFDGMALTWTRMTGEPPTVVVRTGTDDALLGSAVRLDAEGGPDPGTDEHAGDAGGSSFLWTGGSRCARIALDMPAGSALAGLRVVFVNSSGTAEGPGSGPEPAGPIATGSAAPLPGASAMTRRPRIITREQWGANPRLMNCTPDVASYLKVGFVHHTAGSNSYSRQEADDVVRGVYAYHTQGRGWCDIGYNFLVDRYGHVFEGRSGGVTENVIGAAQMGFNTGAFSVSLMGTFDSSPPPRAAVRALRRLFAWRLDVGHIDPTKRAELTSAGGRTTRYAAGTVVRLRTISGHRDTGLTACPGGSLYRLLPKIRSAVARIGLPKLYAPRLSLTTLTAGETQRIRVTARGSRTLIWSVTVLGPDGSQLLELPADPGDRLSVAWDATFDVPGTYRVVVAAASAKGRPARPAELPFTVGPAPSPSPDPSPGPSPSESPSPTTTP